ncbi:hypothetical protein SAMN05661093_10740 [Kibdelosporangium aridum]|uniref:Uncharacterized protein n=1 Tax=Kibdelosporangium aridum TaxID=2030 RepID=A0A1Y5Y8K2_KIBAR|nr:hypothetical protein SAMN05661093_10740 [Kibdelosporangium aridum]
MEKVRCGDHNRHALRVRDTCIDDDFEDVIRAVIDGDNQWKR